VTNLLLEREIYYLLALGLFEPDVEMLCALQKFQTVQEALVEDFAIELQNDIMILNKSNTTLN
jgi:hypothetical protein